ncbi:MAG: helix-turn-helix domain-containing protein [Planctomycetia bacterium]|nr:MAG: helix-turn-helix domain-containing protein [Planctomycetia bacterium]
MTFHDSNISTPTALLAITTEELAELLRVSIRHIQRQESAGKIGPKPVRFGKSKRYVLDGPNGIRAWLAAGAPDRREWEARQRMQGGAT